MDKQIKKDLAGILDQYEEIERLRKLVKQAYAEGGMR